MTAGGLLQLPCTFVFASFFPKSFQCNLQILCEAEQSCSSWTSCWGWNCSFDLWNWGKRSHAVTDASLLPILELKRSCSAGRSTDKQLIQCPALVTVQVFAKDAERIWRKKQQPKDCCASKDNFRMLWASSSCSASCFPQHGGNKHLSGFFGLFRDCLFT